MFGRLEQLAQSKQCTTAQLALAWILANALSCTSEDVAALEAAFPVGVAAGPRYPPESMRLLETEQNSQ